MSESNLAHPFTNKPLIGILLLLQQHPMELSDNDVVCHFLFQTWRLSKDSILIPGFVYRVWKIGPALATGCTIVMKPSELTPLTSLVRQFIRILLVTNVELIETFRIGERSGVRGF